MKNTRTNLKKICVGILSFTLVFNTVYLALPSDRALAIAGVTPEAFEVNPLVVGGIVDIAAAGTVTAANETTQTVIMQILNGLAWTVAKTAIQSLTQSIVNWINSGFQGSPGFITDLKQNLSTLADTVADDFLNGLTQVVYSNTGINIQSPFQDQIAAALREEFYRTTSSYGFDVRNPYTLKTACDPHSFTKGDNFSRCGLDGFFEFSQNPANNPIGRYDLARNELFRRLDSNIQQRKTELDWGKGFLSWRGSCGQFAKPTTTTKSTASGGTGAAKNTAAGGTGATAGAGAVKDTSAKVSLEHKDPSAGCPIRTPGALIENTLGISATSPFRQLELADSINEIVAALAGQLVNQVLGGGGLAGVSQPAPGGGSSFIDRASNPSLYTSGPLGTVVAELDRSHKNALSVQSSIQRVIARLDEAKRQCSAHPDIVRQWEASRQDLIATNEVPPRSIAATESLKTKILEAQKSSASTSNAQLIAEYQSLITKDLIYTDAEAAAEAAQTQKSLASIDNDVKQLCTP